jgi:hypothetical protein
MTRKTTQLDQLMAGAQRLTGRIPAYVIDVMPGCRNVRGLLESDPKVFLEHFGIPLTLFREMIDAGAIIESRLDRLLEGMPLNPSPAMRRKAVELDTLSRTH